MDILLGEKCAFLRHPRRGVSIRASHFDIVVPSAKSTSSFYSCTDSHQGRDLAVMSREKCRTIDVAMIAPLLSFLYLIHLGRECPSDLLSSPLLSLPSLLGPSSNSPPQPSLCPTQAFPEPKPPQPRAGSSVFHAPLVFPAGTLVLPLAEVVVVPGPPPDGLP